MKFILGKKQNMTQVLDANGKVIPATVFNGGPISAVQIKTKEKDGYEAVVFGYGSKKEKQRFVSREGGKTVGAGVVTKIIK